jgi:hypothetical protein
MFQELQSKKDEKVFSERASMNLNTDFENESFKNEK